MNGKPVTTWREHADEQWNTWTAADPLTVTEPWTWTCPECAEVMARPAIAAHRAAHAIAPARGMVIGMVLGGLLWVLLFALAAVVIARVVR